MPNFTREQAKHELSILVDTYRATDSLEIQSEANVRANFIDPLFEILGWPTNNPLHYNREEYVRGTGYADIALKVASTSDTPLLYVEAKRFGAIDLLNRVQEKRNRDVAQLRFQLPGMSVDRTREEQQAINYAYQQGMRWAILTNFERFRLFNARRDTLVLSFESPQELLERFDELWQLSFEEVKQGSLAGLRAHRERLDIDEEYLRLINVWRLRLGEDIVSHRENLILLTDLESGEIDVLKLREVVQRILDRLVVIRYAEDRLVIKADQLRTLIEIRERSDYGVPLLDQIRYFFQEFNVRHNGALFAEHLCDRLTITEDVLHAIIVNLYDARFRAMSADIMGNTYEQYLGQTLVIKKGTVHAVDNVETRKAQGSYYTPEYIVDQTLGRYLYGTFNGRPDGNPIPGQQKKQLEEIDGSNGRSPLTVIDPACGSGSFLMNAYHVLERFYLSEINRITSERDQRFAALSKTLSPFDLQIELAGYTQRLTKLKGFRNQILERHIYGIDLDPQAAELAAVNLMLRAMRRDMRLPLILNQNIKVGNSLLAGLPLSDPTLDEQIAPFAKQLSELRRLRLAQQGIAEEKSHPIQLQGQIERLTQEINQPLNQSLTLFFEGDLLAKRPFNWLVEFPEIFLNGAGQLHPDGGFTLVIGNPPYLSIDDTWGNNSPDASYLKAAFATIWAGKSDIYYYFFRQGLSLLQPNGLLGFITARYYLEAYYAQKIRQVILDEAIIRQIVDFSDYTIFNRVGTKTCITLLENQADDEKRQANILLSDKTDHKKIDIQHFLTHFQTTAYPFKQNELNSDSWNLYGQGVAQLINKIDANSHPLGNIVFIGKGMETGRNPVFVIDQKTIDQHQIESDLLRKNIKNQDISRYTLAFRGLYLIYPEDIDTLDAYPNTKAYLEKHRASLESRAAYKRGDCAWWQFTWPLHKDKYQAQKILSPYIASHNRFALDTSAEYVGLTDTTIIFSTEESPNLYYLLALLNSELLTFRYRFIGKAKDYRFEYFENGLRKIPIRLASPKIADKLIDLSKQMVALNSVRQLVYNEFQDLLEATSHTVRDFHGAYFTHDEYKNVTLYRTGKADANVRGTVTNIAVHEEENQLVFWISEEEKGDMRLLSLEVPDEPFRRFLLLAMRVKLLENGRKKIWARGKLLQSTLGALPTPVLKEAAALTNIEQIYRFMEELKVVTNRKAQTQLSDHADNLPVNLLDLGSIEKQLNQTDAEINKIVFDLYKITDKEDIELIKKKMK